MYSTNLNQKIEPSIDESQFFSTVLHLSESDRLMLASSTLRRITSEVMNHLHDEFGQRPDYSKVFELLHELDTYGFKVEAHELLTQTGESIEEIAPEFFACFKLQAMSFDGYEMKEKWMEAKGSFFKGWKIFVENCDLNDTNIHLTFCLLGNEDSSDLYTNAIIPYCLFEDYLKDSGKLNGTDSSIDTGHLIEKPYTLTIQMVIEQGLEQLVKEYVYDGGEVIIL